MGKDGQILATLADGQFHSGQELAEQFGLSRSGIWKAIQLLQSKGVEVFAVQGKGYRLAQPLELLNAATIQASIADDRGAFPGEVTVLWDVDSTNRYLVERASNGCAAGSTCLAEMQTAGRGRRGREWVSPLGGNIYLSQLWQFNCGPAQLSGLSLAAAIAVVRVIHRLGIASAGLKWPNDILVNGEKLAGILLEIQGESSGPSNVVVGLGVNVRIPESISATIDQPHTSMEKLLGKPVRRNQLAANLIREMMSVYEIFMQKGFAAFLEEWCALDVYQSKKVNLTLPAGVITGISRGVDISGALKLEQNGEISSFQSGEISLRG